uniref:Uncharacterized protein n=1 Tax=Anguilla anguilla TaxID=7936 RepID=A0A0E9RSB7_ANGAN
MRMLTLQSPSSGSQFICE